VHDIGKNIVGVVLRCNSYEVDDLGVMVPADRILKRAKEIGAHAIGLSGLITPSLDEMVHVAKEMERQGLDLPLLIGGATTSRQHTAVKIAPAYGETVVHVLDASRAVNVVGQVLDPKHKKELDDRNRAEQAKLRRLFTAKQKKPLVPLETARENAPVLAWNAETVAEPAVRGRQLVEDVTVADLRPFIDWTFFFHTWELKGKFPDILEHPEHGHAAREVYEHAQELLEGIVKDDLLHPRGVFALWPACSEGDDVVLFEDESRGAERRRLYMLRQQQVRGGEDELRCLADFVAPRSTGLADWVGGFAVTAGPEVGELSARYERDHDDYNAIMVKALADRLAEAFAELLHQRVRRLWYAPDEDLEGEDLIRERYRGIRPAYGYPACPDHSEKVALFDLLDAAEVGIELTDQFSMLPASSVSGIYLGHPASRYFNVGRLDRDQVEDYARRKGATVEQAERWLAPNLGYEPGSAEDGAEPPAPAAVERSAT